MPDTRGRSQLDAHGPMATTYDGPGDDIVQAGHPTADGGCVLAGWKRAPGAGAADGWVLKLQADGTIAWQKAYGGVSRPKRTSQAPGDHFYAIQETANGGYVLAGWTDSFGAGDEDAWVVRLDAAGTVVWQKTYGGTARDEARDIQQTTDGGYVVVGVTRSFGFSAKDLWVLRLDAVGAVIWQKTYGGPFDDYGLAVQGTGDGGYVVAGMRALSGYYKTWVLKLAADGQLVWQKIYDGHGDEAVHALQATTDGGCILAGKSYPIQEEYDPEAEPFDGDVDIGPEAESLEVDWETRSEAWALKLHGDGSVAWRRAFYAQGDGVAQDIHQTMDGGYVLAGHVGYPDADILVLKLTGDGHVVWQRTYGREDADWAQAIWPMGEGGFVVAGDTSSFQSTADAYAWLFEIDARGEPGPACCLGKAATVTSAKVRTRVIVTDVIQFDSQALVADSRALVRDTAVRPGSFGDCAHP